MHLVSSTAAVEVVAATVDCHCELHADYQSDVELLVARDFVPALPPFAELLPLPYPPLYDANLQISQSWDPPFGVA